MTLFRKNKSKGDVQTEFQTTVRFLDDSEPIQLPFTKDTVGQFVLDKVCETLNLVEKDYFGLRFVDGEKQRHWLDPTKTVYKQLKGVSPCVLCFRVKFYPADPMKLHEEITRYYLFLQLRRDLHHGRLLCSPQDANLLAAYIIQSEVGDYDPQDHPPGYVAEFKMLPNQNIQQEQQIQDLHKTLTGQVPAEAEANFLKKAASLDTYGVDPHKVKDQKGAQMYLGVTYQGIMTFHGSRRTQLYKWNQIKKLAFEGKTFIPHVNINESENVEAELDSEQSSSKKKHQPIGYKCLTNAACKYLWRCAVEQQFFFTLSNTFSTPKVRSGGSLFSRGSKFRFSGRCQNEAYIASEDIKRQEPDFQRTCSLPNFARRSDAKVHMRNSANLSDSITEDNKGGNKYKAETLPRMTVTPSVSAEPAFENRRNSCEGRDKKRNSRGEKENPRDSSLGDKENRRDSRGEKENRRDSRGERDNKRDSREMKGEVTENKRNSFDAKRPKLREIARQSSKETVTYTEVEQRRTVLDERPIVAEVKTEVKSVQKPVRVVVETVNSVPKPARQESPIDVPGSTSTVKSSPKIKAPLADTEDTVIEEEITQAQSAAVESQVIQSKQNGGIPIIVTPATDTNLSGLVYEPEESIYDQDDDSKLAKSLEEQVLELEKEFERNHTENIVEDRVEATMTAKTESTPNHVDSKVATQPKKGGCSCCKVLAVTFFFIFLTLTVTVCVVMFSDIKHPVMNQLRTHLSFLEPTRDFIQDKVNKVFRKS